MAINSINDEKKVKRDELSASMGTIVTYNSIYGSVLLTFIRIWCVNCVNFCEKYEDIATNLRLANSSNEDESLI